MLVHHRLEAVVGGHRGQRGVVGRGDGTVHGRRGKPINPIGVSFDTNAHVREIPAEVSSLSMRNDSTIGCFQVQRTGRPKGRTRTANGNITASEIVDVNVDAAKPYFDPAEGCYIRLAEEGKVSRGVLEKGPAGFCLVRFEDEEPFPSEVPNLWLAPQAAESGPKLKRVRATGKGKGKGKGKSTRALLLHQLLKKLQQILKAIPGRKLALWRALQQSLFLLRLPQLPRRFCLECMTSLVCLWKHSLQRAARASYFHQKQGLFREEA